MIKASYTQLLCYKEGHVCINSVLYGVDIRRLQQVTGHPNINITAIYLQFNDKDVQEAYANMPC